MHLYILLGNNLQPLCIVQLRFKLWITAKPVDETGPLVKSCDRTLYTAGVVSHAAPLTLSFHNNSVLWTSVFRTSNLTTSQQSQIQNLLDNLSKITDERNLLKEEVVAKRLEIQEKVETISQVKKLGRRYKTQYDDLKVQHDKVSDPNIVDSPIDYTKMKSFIVHHLDCSWGCRPIKRRGGSASINSGTAGT